MIGHKKTSTFVNAFDLFVGNLDTRAHGCRDNDVFHVVAFDSSRASLTDQIH